MQLAGSTSAGLPLSTERPQRQHRLNEVAGEQKCTKVRGRSDEEWMTPDSHHTILFFFNQKREGAPSERHSKLPM
eukprot:31614-Eustigmatos_ZCMA.PRE.1